MIGIRHTRIARPLFGAVLALSLVSLAAAGCNFIDVVRGRHAKISKMVPGGNIANGELDCWITLEFDRYPDGADLRDVRIRFESIALVEPAEFDWAYIASRDVVAQGSDFGSGHRKAEATQPGGNPPLGQPTKVRLPLRAKRKIENAPSTLWLEAELFWGGEKQDSLRRSLEHVYASSPNGFF
jgi:hypothetical protein